MAVAEHDERIVDGTYVAGELFGDRIWNLHFLAVAHEAHGAGAGSALLRHVESSTETYSRTRTFYRNQGFVNQGFVEESRTREFYGPGDHEVTFWKSLVD